VGQSQVGIIPVDGSSPPALTPANFAAALDALFRGNDAWLRAALRKRYGPDLADDLAQETYLRAAPYKLAGEIRHPKALLLRIARGIASNLARDTRLEVLSDTVANQLPEHSEPAPQEHALTLKQIVLALPVELRDIFVLNHIQGLTYQEIATLRDIPLTTVHHRMRQALARTSSAMRD
jgi:RNA polymerase sigma factor (sigma-70 family)